MLCSCLLLHLWPSLKNALRGDQSSLTSPHTPERVSQVSGPKFTRRGSEFESGRGHLEIFDQVLIFYVFLGVESEKSGPKS